MHEYHKIIYIIDTILLLKVIVLRLGLKPELLGVGNSL